MFRSVFALIFLVQFSLIFSLKHDLKVNHDNRQHFFIEKFGFEVGGYLKIELSGFKINGKPYSSEYDNKVGFLIRRTDTDAGTFLGESDKDCTDLLQIKDERDGFVIPIKEKSEKKIEISGLYNIFFVNCENKPVSFRVHLTLYNIINGEKNYLSIGYSPLPTVYGLFAAIYIVILLLWVFAFLKRNWSSGTVHRIHHLMTVLISLKFLSIMCKAFEFHYIKTTGTPEGWNIAYYIFAGLKGTMLFIMIALIGSGWTFIKPFLSQREKKIFLVVIPLQILDNIALIIIEETAPGSQDWSTWENIFRLVDIICCGAILIPIVWSIKHLREAASIDGKAARNVKKLELFRQFYLIVISYLYFTRIIVYLVDATLPFRLIWLGDFFTELATLLFFCITGYKFRPEADNPYFTLTENELELEEEGGERDTESDIPLPK